MTFLAVKNTTKIAITILQGSAVTQYALGGLIMCRLFANFLQCTTHTSAKIFDNRLTNVIVVISHKVGPFLRHRV